MSLLPVHILSKHSSRSASCPRRLLKYTFKCNLRDPCCGIPAKYLYRVEGNYAEESDFLLDLGCYIRYFRIGTEEETTKTRRHDGRSPGLPGYDVRESAA